MKKIIVSSLIIVMLALAVGYADDVYKESGVEKFRITLVSSILKWLDPSANVLMTLTDAGTTGTLTVGALDLTTPLPAAEVGVLGADNLPTKIHDIDGLAATDSNFIVGNGTTWVAETGTTARTSLGLGTGDKPIFSGLQLVDHANENSVLKITAHPATGTYNSEIWFGDASDEDEAIWSYDNAGTGNFSLTVPSSGGLGITGLAGAPHFQLYDGGTHEYFTAYPSALYFCDEDTSPPLSHLIVLLETVGSTENLRIWFGSQGSETYHFTPTQFDTVGGVHIGGTSAPGVGNLLVDGKISTPTITTFTADDTTPTVAAGNIFKVPATWTTGHNITMFDNGVAGQEITIIGGDADCVIVDGGDLFLSGNTTATATIVLTLVFDGNDWWQKGIVETE